MHRDLLLAIALGGVSALAHVAVPFGGVGGMIIALLAPLPVFYAGLALGPRSIVVSGLAGTAVSLLFGGWIAAGYLVEVAIGPWLLVRRAVLFRTAPDETTEWYPIGWLFGWLAGIAGVALLAVHLWFLSADGGLTGALQGAVKAYLDRLQEAGVLTELRMQQDPDAIASVMAQVLPGAAAAVWILVMIANGTLAQGLALRFGKAIRPVVPLVTMVLPTWLVLTLPAALVMSFAGGWFGAMAASLVPVGMVPLLFQGCAVIHVLARRTPVAGLVIGCFYALMLVMGALVLVVILLGLAEHWLKVRRRVVGAGGSGG